MKNQIAAGWKQIHMLPQNLTHPSLDSIPLMRLAQHLACREPHSWDGHVGLRSKKPAHRSGTSFPPSLIDALVVGMLPKTVRNHRRTPALPHSRSCGARISFGRCGHGKAGGIPAGKIVLFLLLQPKQNGGET
jgi:hypothetical protein